MERDDFQDGVVPEGWDAIEVVESDDVEVEGDDEVEVLLDEDGNRIEEDEQPASRRRQSDEDNSSDADRFRRERDEARAEADRLRQKMQGVENQDAWKARKAQINRDYKTAKARIFELSNNAEEPNEFIDREIERLNDWKEMELEKEFQARETVYMGEIVKLRLPEYAEKLGKDYGLKAADVKRIKEAGNPAKMEAMAEALYDIQREQARVATNNRKAARHTQQAVTTSGGSRGGVRKVKAGSDEHLALLLAGARSQ